MSIVGFNRMFLLLTCCLTTYAYSENITETQTQENIDKQTIAQKTMENEYSPFELRVSYQFNDLNGLVGFEKVIHANSQVLINQNLFANFEIEAVKFDAYRYDDFSFSTNQYTAGLGYKHKVSSDKSEYEYLLYTNLIYNSYNYDNYFYREHPDGLNYEFGIGAHEVMRLLPNLIAIVKLSSFFESDLSLNSVMLIFTGKYSINDNFKLSTGGWIRFGDFNTRSYFGLNYQI